MLGPSYRVLIALDGDLEEHGLAAVYELGWADEPGYPMQLEVEEHVPETDEYEAFDHLVYYDFENEDAVREWASERYRQHTIVNLNPPRPRREAAR